MSQKCYYTLIAINRGDYYQKGGKVETMRIQHHPEKGAQNRALENRAFQNKKDAV